MQQKPKEKPPDTVKQMLLDILSLAKTVVLTLIVVLLLTHFVIANAIVPTSSMEKTIYPGDRIIGVRFLKNYDRGDIIIFKDPEGADRYLIKRIIGMPGDHIRIVRGEEPQTSYVAVNGTRLNEPYLPEEMITCREFDGMDLIVPENSYFCLGDNRNNSKDARFWKDKFISKDEVIAKACIKYWPLNRAGFFIRPEYE